MTETKWTPGPWRISGKGTVRAGDDWVGSVHWRNREANARLIAAAPDLYEALQKLLDRVEVDRCLVFQQQGFRGAVPEMYERGLMPEQFVSTRAVLAKARGEGLSEGSAA